MPTETLLDPFRVFCFGSEPGLGTWLSDRIHPIVKARLGRLNDEPLSKVQFNQLLVVSQVASVSDGFFRYYWRSADLHPYEVTSIDGFDPGWIRDGGQTISTVGHLRWGLMRLYFDGLLFFGNVNVALSSLRSMSYEQLKHFFAAKRFDTDAIAARGPSLGLTAIKRDERYLISEMACKTFGDVPASRDAAYQVLAEGWARHEATGGGRITFRDFLAKYIVTPGTNDQLMLSYDDLADQTIESSLARADFDALAARFLDAREKAIENTERYLSTVNDLDVYVATSMRTRKNFRDMAEACDAIFQSQTLKHLFLRYFDPTLSAARGHEDKGLIECLMVKCSKVLVYCEGEKDSYGKDAEAAMALSLGKPVVFYCDHGKKTDFFRDTHPLCRLIDFRSGVAVGAIITDKVTEVSELLLRLFENRMRYRLEQHKDRPGFLKLVETLTNSVVRLQTNDALLTKTFWNNYNRRAAQTVPSLAAGKEAERLQE